MRRTEGGNCDEGKKVIEVKFCFCVRGNTDKVRFGDSGVCLPGNVVLTVKLDTQVISSSPPVQSSFPSQALSIGMNFTERLQKKYLLSMSCLTGR